MEFPKNTVEVEAYVKTIGGNNIFYLDPWSMQCKYLAWTNTNRPRPATEYRLRKFTNEPSGWNMRRGISLRRTANRGSRPGRRLSPTRHNLLSVYRPPHKKTSAESENWRDGLQGTTHDSAEPVTSSTGDDMEPQEDQLHIVFASPPASPDNYKENTTNTTNTDSNEGQEEKPEDMDTSDLEEGEIKENEVTETANNQGYYYPESPRYTPINSPEHYEQPYTSLCGPETNCILCGNGGILDDVCSACIEDHPTTPKEVPNSVVEEMETKIKIENNDKAMEAPRPTEILLDAPPTKVIKNEPKTPPTPVIETFQNPLAKMTGSQVVTNNCPTDSPKTPPGLSGYKEAVPVYRKAQRVAKMRTARRKQTGKPYPQLDMKRAFNSINTNYDPREKHTLLNPPKCDHVDHRHPVVMLEKLKLEDIPEIQRRLRVRDNDEVPELIE